MKRITLPLTWDNDNELRRVFTWLTRIGASPKFGSRPIGWYQQHQMKVIDWLENSKARGLPLRCKHGMVQAKPSVGLWFDVATVEQLYAEGDKRT